MKRSKGIADAEAQEWLMSMSRAVPQSNNRILLVPGADVFVQPRVVSRCPAHKDFSGQLFSNGDSAKLDPLLIPG